MSNNSIVNNSQLEDKRDDCSEVTKRIPGVISAAEILATEWPDLDWVIQGLMPTGLSFLAGAPKVGKSWLALQIAKAVSSGESILGHDVTKGKVLYLALEDSGRRLKTRIVKQDWHKDSNVDFMTLPEYLEKIKDLKGDGTAKLGKFIETGKYMLVIIDTLSRALFVDQNDVSDMTACLSPLQATALRLNCAILLIDHHRKLSSKESPDAITDVLGSTAKGGVADTIMGVYKKRGSSKAQFSVTGRDIDETTIDILWEKSTGCWSLPNDKTTPQLDELLAKLEEIGPISNQELAEALRRRPGTVLKQLNQLHEKGLVVHNEDKTWVISEAD